MSVLSLQRELEPQNGPIEVARRCGTAPALFSAFNPYIDDQGGVSAASGFVDFTPGRYSIVTAPGSGATPQVKVFNFSLIPYHEHHHRRRCARERGVGGQSGAGSKVPVRRPTDDATTPAAESLSQVLSTPGTSPAVLGGD